MGSDTSGGALASNHRQDMVIRKSLFGPLFIIALGILLLVHNLDPRFSIGRIFAEYWPWILILWGGFRLVELAAARLMGRRMPEPLGAGAIIVALFLCLIGATAHSLVIHRSDFFDWMMHRGHWFHL